MKLKELLQGIETKNEIRINPEITNISDSTAKIRSGGAFICICGSKSDGHSFAPKAIETGAEVIICERDIGIENCVIVKDTRKAYALMCSNFCENSHRKMKMIGITGTNGKTSTSFILKKILENAGHKVGLIGTVSVIIGSETHPAELTTPDPADLHKFFKMMYEAGCDTCIMEVSSQALVQQRVCGITFDCGIFTNLSPEHLDYHKTMENYAQAKAKLFGECKSAVLNADDEYSEVMKAACSGKIVEFSAKKKSDVSAENVELSTEGVRYILETPEEKYNVDISLMGGFSVYNSMAALSAAYLMGEDIGTAVGAIKEIDGVEGRMEKVPNKLGINVIIDFAHTPDSLENALKTVRSVYSGRLLTVFGCGGDRDKTKRPLMGRIACEYSDTVYITSDNSRTEDPEAIIDDIIRGIDKENYFRITDRTQALKSAIFAAKQGETVLIAGKGHEKYQIIGKQKTYYNEREIVRNILEEKARL